MWTALSSQGFPGDSVVKNPPANAGDTGDVVLVPESGRSPGVGSGNTLQYSCLENPMDRGAWRATVHGVAKNWTWFSGWARTLSSHWPQTAGSYIYFTPCVVPTKFWSFCPFQKLRAKVTNISLTRWMAKPFLISTSSCQCSKLCSATAHLFPSKRSARILLLQVQSRTVTWTQFLSIFFLSFFFFWPHSVVCGILVTWLGIEPGSWQWKCWIITSKPLGNSFFFFGTIFTLIRSEFPSYKEFKFFLLFRKEGTCRITMHSSYLRDMVLWLLIIQAQTVKDLPAMQETWVWSLGWEGPLEKVMINHSSILAWRIPGTEEPERLSLCCC